MKSFISTLTLILAFSLASFAQQKFELIRSGDVIREGIKFHQNKDYAKAIEKYSLVNENDTNYHIAIYEIGLSYQADSNFVKALAYAEKGLTLGSDLDHQFFQLKANTLDYLGRQEEAIQVFDEALKLYPKNPGIHYNKAVTLERMDRFQEAVDAYKTAIYINPYHINSHVRLGMLCASFDHIVEAMLSLNMALLLEPGSQRAFSILTILELISKDEFEKRKGKIVLNKEGDDFSDIALILRNKVALNSKYKVKSKLNYPVIRQNQALLEKLKENPRDKGFWHDIYIPVFAKIYSANQFEAYSYLMVSSVDNKEIQAIIKKNSSKIEKFKQWIYPELNTSHTQRNEWKNGKKEDIYFIYNSNNVLIGTGKMDATGKTSVGEWEIFNTYGRLAAKGSFDKKGDKTGEWKWYYENGNLKEVSSYKDNKPVDKTLLYFKNGNLSAEVFWKNGKKDGEYLDYYRFGGLWSKTTYKDGVKDGKTTIYHKNGNKQYELFYKNDQIHGLLKQYYADEKLLAEVEYANGERHGMSKKYHQNGQLSEELKFVNGKQDGEYKSYFDNGKIKDTGNYKNGNPVGVWKEFNKFEKLITEITYDESGKMNGSRKEFTEEGILRSELEYSKGDIVAYKYYDKAGKILNEDKKKRNVLPIKGYYITGELYVEGGFEGGERTGEWKFYTRNGVYSSVSNYVKGQLHGKYTDYFNTGQVFYEVNYKNGERDGYYVQYYRNGKVSKHGWYENGDKTGPWIDYHPNGNLESELFYVRGELHGKQKWFDELGNLYEITNYYYDDITGIETYDKDGKLTANNKIDNGEATIALNYNNGKIRYNAFYKNTLLEGAVKWNYYDGSEWTTGNFFNGKRHGNWVWYHENKKVSSKGAYSNGDRTGKWEYFYENGQLSSAGNYEQNKREGEWLWYYENGKIKYKRFYINGERNGEDISYSPSGEVMLIRNYDYGTLVSYTYYDKDKKPVTPVIFNKESGELLSYYPNGNKAVQMNFLNGSFNGKYITWYPNGKIIEESEYLNGDANGASKTYYENGVLKSEENYLAGSLNGVCKYYHENGKLKEELTYESGSLFGKSKYYDKNGKLIKERTYYNNRVMDEKILQ